MRSNEEEGVEAGGRRHTALWFPLSCITPKAARVCVAFVRSYIIPTTGSTLHKGRRGTFGIILRSTRQRGARYCRHPSTRSRALLLHPTSILPTNELATQHDDRPSRKRGAAPPRMHPASEEGIVASCRRETYWVATQGGSSLRGPSEAVKKDRCGERKGMKGKDLGGARHVYCLRRWRSGEGAGGRRRNPLHEIVVRNDEEPRAADRER
jgi:hypothetical protein